MNYEFLKSIFPAVIGIHIENLLNLPPVSYLYITISPTDILYLKFRSILAFLLLNTSALLNPYFLICLLLLKAWIFSLYRTTEDKLTNGGLFVLLTYETHSFLALISLHVTMKCSVYKSSNNEVKSPSANILPGSKNKYFTYIL